jgi:hypothetical protein
MLVCFLPCTRGCGCIGHPAFPAPSDFQGQEFKAKLARKARRDREVVSSRHCEERSDEAIHSFFVLRDGLLRFARNDGQSCGCLKFESRIWELTRAIDPRPVMAGLVPAIHVLVPRGRQDVDARDKRGHDGGWDERQRPSRPRKSLSPAAAADGRARRAIAAPGCVRPACRYPREQVRPQHRWSPP